MDGRRKTGLAARIRDWMRQQSRAFRPRDVSDGIGARWHDRDKVRNAFPDFLARGEITQDGFGRYRYNQEWKRNRPAPLSKRIYKAMYLSRQFTSFDIQRLSGADSRNFIQKRIRRLLDGGYIECLGNVPGKGNVRFYRVVNRQRFRIELL